jgi:site-specific recombinase XerD
MYCKSCRSVCCQEARFKGSATIAVLSELGYKGIEAYIKDRRSRKAKPPTLRKARSAIKSFYKYLGNQGLVVDNPVNGLESMKQSARVQETPSEREVNAALDQVGNCNPYWPARDQAIFELCYEGLSESDLVALNLFDIDLARGAVHRHPDGKPIPIGPMAQQSLRIWLSERAQYLRRNNYAEEHSPALFIGFKHLDDAKIRGRIEPRTVCHIIQRIRPGWSPRLLRNACGVHMLNHGASPLIVAHQLGVGLGAVGRLLKMATKRRGEVIRQTHPRATPPPWDHGIEWQSNLPGLIDPA